MVNSGFPIIAEKTRGKIKPVTAVRNPLTDNIRRKAFIYLLFSEFFLYPSTLRFQEKLFYASALP